MSEQTESARIYQFPVGGRDGYEASRQAKRLADEASTSAVAWAVGESWYHAEAIRDEREPRH